MMPHSHLQVHTCAGYTWLRLNRPECRNALDPALTRALRDQLAAMEPRRPLILGSSDPQVFCAGADLTISDAGRAEVSDLLYDCCEILITRPGPVIAVLTGAAVGGGAQLAAAADLRLASPGARLRWTGPPGMHLVVGAWLLPDLVGRSVAMDLVLTGRWLSAAEATERGLVHQLTDDPGTAAETLASALSTAPVKQVMNTAGLLDRLKAERLANQAAWARRVLLPGLTNQNVLLSRSSVA
ncbi:MAG TPA: enoyl-CoA hydratase/isomerase family protein [Streptosporangiaceae bacterium]|jgi:enoyl-CoA hydratase|nr:enoyl-CoA hydratase/isomerase family protein [Streptosporangiaceae bacterium]